MEFRERTQELEQDARIKQIIPYFVVRRSNEYFTARRRDTGGEKRLYGGRLIGFGGHLRAEDIKGKMSEWLKREFEEELEVDRVLGISFLGIVNHDGNEDKGVHRVHFGLVFEVNVAGDVQLRKKGDLQDGEFMSVEELQKRQGEMELWSKLVTGFLASRSYG
jgi:predicted NUDIX family phosphoesterase